MKLGLIKLKNEKIVGVQYLESKFDRELGDTLNIDGVKWRVGIIGDTKNDVIIALNGIIKEINAITRRANKIEDRRVFNSLFRDLNLERYI
jgi:hypothetical protein